MYTLGVLTSSDLGAKGEREDTSGSLIRQTLTAPDYELKQYAVTPDDRSSIEHLLTDGGVFLLRPND